MSQVGNYTKQMFSLVVQENPNMWYGQIKGILKLRDIYSDEIVDLSCRRGIYFGITKYSKINSV